MEKGNGNEKATFPAGLFVKPPHGRAPKFVKARIAIKREELAKWLAEQVGDWIDLDVKVSQGGNWYAAVDSYKRGQGAAAPAGG